MKKPARSSCFVVMSSFQFYKAPIILGRFISIFQLVVVALFWPKHSAVATS